MVKIKKYQKKFDYSYALGVYPSLELLKAKREYVQRVVLNSDGLENEGVKEILSICRENKILCEENDKAIQKIAVKENTYVATFFTKFSAELNSKANHIVLHHPRNKGNIGTIIRTMLGFDFLDLAIIEPAADLFDPKVVRSTMGAIAHVRFSKFKTLEEYHEQFSGRSLMLFMLDADYDLRQADSSQKYSLVFGNESEGLPDSARVLGKSFKIPQSDAIDSLNLSISAGVAMYHMRHFAQEGE